MWQKWGFLRPGSRFGVARSADAFVLLLVTVLVVAAVVGFAAAGISDRLREVSETQRIAEVVDQVGRHRHLAGRIHALVLQSVAGGADVDELLDATKRELSDVNQRARDLVASSRSLKETDLEARLAEIETRIDLLVSSVSRFSTSLSERASEGHRVEFFLDHIAGHTERVVGAATAINEAIASDFAPATQAARHLEQDIYSAVIVLLLIGYLALVILPARRRMLAEAGRLARLSNEVLTLSAVARRTSNGVIVTDVEGRVEWNNLGFERMSGYSSDEVKGRKFGSFLCLDGSSTSLLQRAREAHLSETSFDIQVEGKTKNGRSYWFDLDVQPLFSDRQELIGYTAIKTDITNLKQASEEITRRNRDLEMMSSLATIGLWSLDLGSDVVYWSDEIRKIHEVASDYEPNFARAIEFYPEDARRVLMEGLENCRDTRVPWDAELPFVTAKGTARWVRVYATAVEENGQVTKLVGALQDITTAVTLREQIRVSGQRLELALEGAAIGLWEWNVEEDQYWIHPAWGRHLGYARDVEAEGASPEIHPDDIQTMLSAQKGFLGGLDHRLSYEVRQRVADGEWRWVSATGRATSVDEHGRVKRATGVYVDIHDRKIATERALYASKHDAMTGLLNREEFIAVIERQLASCSAVDGEIGVLVIDLDRFKCVNDTYGHLAGDAVLAEAAHRLRGCVRQGDAVARLGGDEFAVLISGDRNCHEQCTQVATRIMAEMSAPFLFEGRSLDVGASIGVGVSCERTCDADVLLRNADAALYYVKENGRRAFRFFDQDLAVRAEERRALEADLSVALQRNELELHFQPQVCLQSNKTASIEALLRWQHPTRGWVRPDVFIPIAEDTGLIVPIGEWVIQEACRIAAAWPQPVAVSVNLSTAQLGKSDLMGVVTKALLAAGLAPDRLEIEVTESVFLREDTALLADLHELHGLGVRLALDDFGTGYACLGYLQKLPFDKIKIDRSFVADIEGNEKSTAIVRAIVHLANSLGADTTAEGVETAAQATLVAAVGCTNGQGYFFSRPVPPKELFLMHETIAAA